MSSLEKEKREHMQDGQWRTTSRLVAEMLSHRKQKPRTWFQHLLFKVFPPHLAEMFAYYPPFGRISVQLFQWEQGGIAESRPCPTKPKLYEYRLKSP